MRKGGFPGSVVFGLLWIVTNTFAWGMYLVAGLAVARLVWALYQGLLHISFLGNDLNRLLVVSIILGVGWGAIVGALQAFVLTRRFELEAKGWVSATIVGFLLYATLDVLASRSVQIVAMFTPSIQVFSRIVALVPPLGLGIAQWFTLRRYFTSSGWWVAATTLGLWLPTVAFSQFVMGFNTGAWGFIASTSVKGLSYSVATLIALAVFSRQAIAAVESK